MRLSRVFSTRLQAKTGNITLTADEALIDEARALAREESAALNEQFRLWLEACTRKRRVARAKEVLERIGQYASSGGREFTRDEMNERR